MDFHPKTASFSILKQRVSGWKRVKHQLEAPQGIHHPAGFSLVEVALAIAVMGLIVAITFPLLSHFLTQQKVNRTESRLEMARGEVLGYAMRTFTLPDGIKEIGHQTDAWRNQLFYERSALLATDLCLFFEQKHSDTNLSLHVASTNSTIKNIAFVIISAGPNAALDTSVSNGTVHILSPSELVNGRKYDDLLVYMTADFLRGKIQDRCPVTDGEEDEEDNDND